ncbi:SDR family oxidoreductase [Thalassospira alkalitolerans]|uniref:SDR family oxidoreductase n=1 Tax=Thalassospira alkalitolerans TaxID=1293890 RepID=UPI0030EC1A26
MSKTSLHGPILLTGGYGGLGSALADRLDGSKEVVRVGRQKAAQYQCDLTDATAVACMISHICPSRVIHFAAATDVDLCEDNPHYAWMNNVLATRNLVEAIIDTAPETSVFFASTDQVYSGVGEHMELNISPVNVYGLTKLWAEEYIQRLSNHLVFRMNFFGVTKSGGVSVLDWLANSAGLGRKITLFDDVLFNPLHANDLIETILLALDQRLTGLFNVGASDGGVSKADFLIMAAQLCNIDVKSFRRGSVDDMGFAAVRPKDMRMNVDRLQVALGVKLPSLSLTLKNLVK